MGFVVKRGDKYSARLVIPKALRPILGQNEFKKSLGTSNKTEAVLRAAPLILHWKKLIEDAKIDGVTAKAKALRRALDNSPNNDLIDEDGFWESIKTGIIEDAIEDIILGGRDIESIDNKEEKAKAKTFFDIASGQVTTLDDYADGWLLSMEHFVRCYTEGVVRPDHRDVSPLLHHDVFDDFPETLFISAGEDSLKEDAVILTDILNAKGSKVEHYEAQGLVHASIRAKGISTATSKAFEIFWKHLS